MFYFHQRKIQGSNLYLSRANICTEPRTKLTLLCTERFICFFAGPQVTYLTEKEFKKVAVLNLVEVALYGKMTIQWEQLWLPKAPFPGWSAFSSSWRMARPFSCAPAHSSPPIWLSLPLTALLITKRRPLGTPINNLRNQSKLQRVIATVTHGTAGRKLARLSALIMELWFRPGTSFENFWLEQKSLGSPTEKPKVFQP